MKKHPESYPWYFTDWTYSETRADMNLEERGLYRELIDLCWLHGSLPNDPGILERWVGAKTCAPFADIFAKVVLQFVLENDGRLHHRKVEEKRAEILALKGRRRDAASRGGKETQRKAREVKNLHRQASAQASAQATLQANTQAPCLTVCSSPSPSLTPSLSSNVKAATISTRARARESRPPVAAAAAAEEDAEPAERKPPGSVTGSSASAQDVEKVDLVRAYLGEVAKIAHLPPADDALLARVLALSGAAHPRVIFEAIRDLNQRRRFDHVQSWGLIPVLLEPYFFRFHERQAAAP